MDIATALDRVEVLSLQPGDTLVVVVAAQVTADDAGKIKEIVRSQLSADVPVLVAPRGTEFKIVRPETTG